MFGEEELAIESDWIASWAALRSKRRTAKWSAVR